MPPDAAAQTRIRERAAVLGRHMFAQGEGRFAAHQVGALLSALRIDEPEAGAVQGGAWASEFGGASGGAPPPTWVREFSSPAFARPSAAWPPSRGGEEWASAFAAQGAPAAPPAWGVDEFLSSRDAAADAPAAGAEVDAAVGAQTRALVATLSADGTPKFRASKFLQFVSKMSRGVLIFEGNGVRDRAAQQHPSWGDEFGGAAGELHAEAAPPARAAAQGDWASDFGSTNAWAEEFEALRAQHPPPDAGDWATAFEGDTQRALSAAAAEGAGHGAASRGGYVFASPNPYASSADPLAEGASLFRRGVLSEAALALEAAAQRDPASVEAWRLLGAAHAENDDDGRAMAALRSALAASPDSREVLLSLGVSATNELDGAAAVGYIAAWLRLSPSAARLAPPPGAALDAVLAAAVAAAAAAPGEADAHTACGVLHCVARDYDAAIASFAAALDLRPGDYSLWNKLGAVQANSARSDVALTAYRRALDLKPNYVRAWCNMGIGYANQGAYEQSAAYYVRALQLNPAADAVWGYLRISLSCCGRSDLLRAMEEHDLKPLLAAFPL